MAVTQIKICNLALIRVGADRISSISQDTKSAIILNAIYEQCRDAVLRDHKWNFALKRVTLDPTGDEPAWGYDYEYDLPADYLREVEEEESSTEYVIEDSKIRSDEPELNLIYIYRNDNESSWDSMFADAFAWKLAMESSYALTQSLALKAECEKSYLKALQSARTMDGAEGTIKGLEATTWTNARR